MFLFAMCLTMNTFFCITNNPYESLNNITVIETGRVSESIAANEETVIIQIFI